MKLFLKSQRVDASQKVAMGEVPVTDNTALPILSTEAFFKLRIQAGPLGRTYFQQQNHPERTSFQTFVSKFPIAYFSLFFIILLLILTGGYVSSGF